MNGKRLKAILLDELADEPKPIVYLVCEDDNLMSELDELKHALAPAIIGHTSNMHGAFEALRQFSQAGHHVAIALDKASEATLRFQRAWAGYGEDKLQEVPNYDIYVRLTDDQKDYRTPKYREPEAWRSKRKKGGFKR